MVCTIKGASVINSLRTAALRPFKQSTALLIILNEHTKTSRKTTSHMLPSRFSFVRFYRRVVILPNSIVCVVDSDETKIAYAITSSIQTQGILYVDDRDGELRVRVHVECLNGRQTQDILK